MLGGALSMIGVDAKCGLYLRLMTSSPWPYTQWVAHSSTHTLAQVVKNWLYASSNPLTCLIKLCPTERSLLCKLCLRPLLRLFRPHPTRRVFTTTAQLLWSLPIESQLSEDQCHKKVIGASEGKCHWRNRPLDRIPNDASQRRTLISPN